MFVRTMKVTAWGLMRDKEKMMIKKEPYGASQINLLSLDSRPHFSAFLRGSFPIFSSLLEERMLEPFALVFCVSQSGVLVFTLKHLEGF